jgi:hypothetical protein
MKTINQIVLACITLGIAPVSADEYAVIKDIIKKVVAPYQDEAKYQEQKIVRYAKKLKNIQQKLRDNNEARKEIRNDIDTRVASHDQVAKARKHKMLLPSSPNKYQDPELRKLRTQLIFLNDDIQKGSAKIDTVQERHIKKAVERCQAASDVVNMFDIQYLQAVQKVKTSKKIMHVELLDKLYTLRQPDFTALRQGYMLNKRTPQEQITLLETNRGIDPMSHIELMDISVARYEQNKLGAPDTYIIQ